MNAHKNPPEFWEAGACTPLCPISFCSSCRECVYRHQCPKSEYPDKDPSKTFVMVRHADGIVRWEEVDVEER